METWELVIIIVASVVLLAVLIAIICLCKRHKERKESRNGLVRNGYINDGVDCDVESQRRAYYRNVESQRRASSNYKIERNNLVSGWLAQPSRPQLNVPGKFQPTNAQKQKRTEPTHITAAIAVKRSKQQFTSATQINQDTSTGYAKLDLHNYRKAAAMSLFKTFLLDSITVYMNSNYSTNNRFILVITGKGLHSPEGKPVIKPAVEDYLDAQKYTYIWANPGMVKIDLLPFKQLCQSILDY